MRDPVEQPGHETPSTPTATTGYAEMQAPASPGTMAATDQSREAERTTVTSPLRDATRRFMRNWAALASLVVIILLALAAIFAHFLLTSSPTTLDYNAVNQGPVLGHWFGTDAEGRDEYSRLLYGLRVPFIISFAGTFITVIIGLALGLLAGFYGGWVDSILGRFTDLMFAFPSFLLALILVSLYGPWFDRKFPNGVGRSVILTLVFAAVSWPPLMRFVRSLALSMKETQFIEAARTVGTTNLKIIVRHLVPNVWGLVLVQASFVVAFIISTEAILSIVGLGVNEPTPDLGAMLWDGAQYMDSNPWGVYIPSIFLIILILAFTFIGDGIRDAVDPRAKE